ncbi:MAG: TetR family transcriptional regulator [Robiginitomaculum sp.]|nr:MAG: TetR family transcriptional regulator [Robiginitomaculum sp.]
MTSKADTLERIIQAAQFVFSTMGLQNAPMEKIAQEAGVTKQLLYHYYKSKHGLFAAVLDENAETILKALMKIDLESLRPSAAMRQILEAAFDQYQNDPTVPALAQEAIAFHKEHGQNFGRFPNLAHPLQQKMTLVIERGIACGAFRPDTNPELFPAMAIMATLGGFYNAYMLSGLLGFDLSSSEGIAKWREYSIKFVLSSILVIPEE